MEITGEENKQGIKNQSEEILTENSSNQVKEKRPTQRNIIIKITKLKDKERILNTAREKQVVTYKGSPIPLSSDFSTETIRPEGSGIKYSR